MLPFLERAQTGGVAQTAVFAVCGSYLLFGDLRFFLPKSRGPQARGFALPKQIRGWRPNALGRLTNTGNIFVTADNPWPVLVS